MCTRNGQCYVGQAGSSEGVGGRWRRHRYALRKGTHPSKYMQRSWNKYGEGAFEWHIIEPVANSKKLQTREQFWMDSLCPKFNTAPAAGSNLGLRMSEAARAKMSATRRGRTKAPRTAEHRENLSRALMGKCWGHHDGETKSRISKKMKGRHISKETREKLSKANSGKTLSEETRSRLSKANTGKVQSTETREKKSRSLKGRQVSEETRRKISETHRKRHRESTNESIALAPSANMSLTSSNPTDTSKPECLDCITHTLPDG